MSREASVNLLVDERAYLLTRGSLLFVALLLVFTGALTDTPELTSSAMLSALLLVMFGTVGVLVAGRLDTIGFEVTLTWVAPIDIVAMGLFVAALHSYGDPVLALVLAFAMFYGHMLEHRIARIVTLAATLAYLVSHVAVYSIVEWYGALFLVIKAGAIIYAGLLSAVMSERHRERQHEVSEAVVERVRLSDELGRRVDELQAILDVNEMVHSSLDLERVGSSIVGILCRTIGIPGAYLMVMDKQRNESLFAAGYGLSGGSGASVSEPVLPSGTAAFDEVAVEVAGDHLTCRSILDHKSLIVMFCTDPASMERLGERETQVLQAASTGLVVAVENSQLYRLTRHIAITDDLTGLYNYRHLQQRLAEETERARRYQKGFSLLMIDVDDFKRFNDTYGHIAGDRALADLGAAIRSAIREVDVAARYGGEEFSVVLPETDPSGAFVTAEKLREAVAVHEFIGGDGTPGPRMTVSVGIASFPHHANDREGLLKQADDALYRAKNDGKDRVRVARTPADAADEVVDVIETGESE